VIQKHRKILNIHAILGLGVSLAIHSLIFFEHRAQPLKRPLDKNPSHPSEVKILVSERQKTSPIQRPVKVKAELPLAKKAKSRNPKAPSVSHTKPLRYADLLPNAGDMSVPSTLVQGLAKGNTTGNGDSAEKDRHPYTGEAYQNIMIDSTILQGIFDIPLFLRQEVDKASASLTVEPLSNSSLNIKLLAGDPYLRALIRECLNNPKAKISLKRIADAMNVTILKVKLSFVSQLAPSPHSPRYLEDIELENGLVSITVTLNKDRLFGPPVAGVSLPDKDAELAKKRDRLRLNALSNSKAFQQTIRGETVTQ